MIDVDLLVWPMTLTLAALIVGIALLPRLIPTRRVAAMVLLVAAGFLLLFPETTGGRTLLANNFRVERSPAVFVGDAGPNINIDTGRRRIWIVVALLVASGVG